jgi:hypothetical protein
MAQCNDYFAINFKYFFPALKGKTALLDKSSNDERCSYYQAYTKGKLKYHCPEKDDPDYIISSFLSNIFSLISHSHGHVPHSAILAEELHHISNCCIIRSQAQDLKFVDIRTIVQWIQGSSGLWEVYPRDILPWVCQQISSFMESGRLSMVLRVCAMGCMHTICHLSCGTIVPHEHALHR